MSDKQWSDAERDEYDALMALVLKVGEGTAARVNRMEELLNDAAQAHRFWASDVERECRRAGFAARIKRYEKERQTVLVSHDGTLLTKPRTIGTTRRIDGHVVHVQTLFDTMTWDELVAKRASYLVTIRTYNEDVAIIDRLLALREAANGGMTPQEAAARLGTTVDDWLGRAA